MNELLFKLAFPNLLGTFKVYSVLNTCAFNELGFPLNLLLFALLGLLFLLNELKKFGSFFFVLLVEIVGLDTKTAQLNIQVRLV